MPNQPNILIIISDQHNKSVMGCAGDEIVRTPNMDRLAEEGMLFSNAYTPSPLCVPARMSFMTSKLPSNNRIWHNNSIMSSGSLTWPHLLAPAGYETALIGRMHFEGPEQKHGFEKRVLAEPMSVYPGAGRMSRCYMKGVPPGSGQKRKVMEETGGKGKGVYEIFDEIITDETCSYLREKAADKDSRPFAAVTGYLLPHCPFIGDPEMYDYYYEKLPDAEVTQEYLDNLPDTVKRLLESRELHTPLSKERVRACQAAYYAMVESMDKLIGQILDTLDETGLSENTMVIYTSDHGEMMNDHGCWTKSCYYEGSVGIPMLVRCPRLVPEKSACRGPVSLVDIGPTILELAGGDSLP
jgi:choline-sulfatase